MPEQRRVVVTGLGAVTPVGNSAPQTWAKEDDAVLREQREDVVAALSPTGLLDHHRLE